MNRVKYPEVDPKSVDSASREDQIKGYSELPGGTPALDFFFARESRSHSGKGIPQTDDGGFVGRAHGWER